MKVKGGRKIYGVPLGILMLDADFPRVPGDMGNAATWPFPVQYRVVKGASPDRVVRKEAHGLLPAFIEAAKELEANGVGAITTNCGFLVLFQDQLAAALSVPVVTSALLQARQIQSLLPSGRRVGILTISSETLTGRHLAAADVPDGVPVVGVASGCELQRVILGNEQELDVAEAESDMVRAARRLTEDHPDVGAILLECTNMPPYAAAVRRATGLPVYSIVALMKWLVDSIE
ncbi:MAG: aspartate/glutamate racemase family protein [Hyphomicrobiales bacterium]|nr:aspartate/glutamate racemase family protein [Hyphomicrobiales bacterium]